MLSLFSALSEEYIDFGLGVNLTIYKKHCIKNMIMEILYFFILEPMFINLIQNLLKINFQKKILNYCDKKEDLSKILSKDNQHQTEIILYRDIARNTD
ncbi:hypothetical protein QIA34_05010 (plasmid) [Borreliella yangtzensis]|uniref:Uncharacterized protein n=1 Tax=Borreliella yangtzensis TaxID=683292 RepID=A0ABR6PBB2_9SPIR|nr:hypothetical protein [Borreliella yangtzensis]